MVTCAVYGCTNRSGPNAKAQGITFHVFPKEKTRNAQWVTALGRNDWQPTKWSTVCSLHFREEDIDRTSVSTVRIRDNVVPSKFPDYPTHVQRCSSDEPQHVQERALLDEVFIKEEPLSPEPSESYEHGCNSSGDTHRSENFGKEVGNMEMDSLVNVRKEFSQSIQMQSDDNLCRVHEVSLNSIKVEVEQNATVLVKQEPECDASGYNYQSLGNLNELTIKQEMEQDNREDDCSVPQDTNNLDDCFPSEYLSLYDKVKVEITEYPIDTTDSSGSIHTDSANAVDGNKNVFNNGNTVSIREPQLQQRKSAGVDRFSCRDCGDNFTKPEDLSRHRRKRDNPLTCELCDKSFKSECVLATHIRIHTGERPFQCKICGKTFLRICYLLKHRRKRHGCTQPDISCQICSKSFSKFGLLSAHMRSHCDVPKVLSCDQCGKHFRRTKYLNRHKRYTHSVEKLRCELCGEVQVTRTALISHVVQHTGTLPFNCGECGEEFSSTLQLARHSRIHKGELPFGCSDCELSFLTAEQLRSHRRYHTGERPYCCIFCGRAFRNEPDLIVHVYSHTDP